MMNMDPAAARCVTMIADPGLLCTLMIGALAALVFVLLVIVTRGE